jgi:hypothetical protein
MKMLRMAAALLAALAGAAATAQEPAKSGPERWEPDIKKMEEADRKAPPARGGVVFAGSSTIVMSKPERWFPELKAVNRGFGGSQIVDSTFYADRIILPLEPSLIVFHAGGNDINGGKEPEQVCADFGAFVRKVHAALPNTRVVFMSLMATRSRWKHWPRMAKANALVEEFCRGDVRLWYVDMARYLMTDNAEPRDDLFRTDKLHLNEDGYRVWTSVLGPVLTRLLWKPAPAR